MNTVRRFWHLVPIPPSVTPGRYADRVVPVAPGPSLRERTWRAVRSEISETAMALFVAHGFEAVTIDQITGAAGISRRSFFRYFDTKEDVVLGDLTALGERLRSALEARPAEEPPWAALRSAFQALRNPEHSPATELAVVQVCHQVPSLRARHLEKHLRWTELLAPDIGRRLGVPGGPTPDPRAQAIVAAALACLDIAVEAWRASGGALDIEEEFDRVVAAVRA